MSRADKENALIPERLCKGSYLVVRGGGQMHSSQNGLHGALGKKLAGRGDGV